MASPSDRPLLDLQAGPVHVIGIMSGTSADGVDAACCRLAHSAPGRLEWAVLGVASVPFPPGIATDLKVPERLTAPVLAARHVELGVLFAAAAESAARVAGIGMEDVALIGSHGQTVWHDPRGVHGLPVSFQITEPAEIAERTGCPVWSDFRPADVAAGGEGAPFVPYVDWLLFTDSHRWRACLNLGGIANVTLLSPGARAEDVLAFDTGPGNMVLDTLAERLMGTDRDEGGRVALEGEPDPDRLAAALGEPYFTIPAPKSTGRELFGAHWTERVFGPFAAPGTAALGPAEVGERMATAAALTVESIALALEGSAGTPPLPDSAEILVSGGGRHNRAVMDGLARRLAPRPVVTTDAYGVDGDYKEAVAFAILAYESALGRAVNLPSVTGARHPARCGKLSFPPPS